MKIKCYYTIREKAHPVFLVIFLFWVSILCAENTGQSKRLLWEVKTVGGDDSFNMLYSVPGKLLAIRNGKLVAYDNTSGKCVWKYPVQGRIRFFNYHQHLTPVTVIEDKVIFCPPFWSKAITGCAVELRLSDGELLRNVNISKEYGFPDQGYENRTECFARRGSHYGVFIGTDKKWEKAYFWPVSNIDKKALRSIERYLISAYQPECNAHTGRPITLAEAVKEIGELLKTEGHNEKTPGVKCAQKITDTKDDQNSCTYELYRTFGELYYSLLVEGVL